MNQPSRRSLRLPYRDYSRPGRYFVTLCAQRKACLFGQVIHGRERWSGAGYMVRRQWAQLARRFPHVEPEDLVVMPNHIHGILRFLEHPRRDRAALGAVIGAFKSLTTNAYIRGVREKNWPRYEGHLWQRGYFERVIRDEEEHLRARKYILMNPAHWSTDSMHMS